ncbi:uncharacterized protein LOC119780900 [Cyprinodon tularosa]|uniref:uncharacterized protein LOC119780900 n=1 Tax=Cyprinodon tularosa TaxID=77115 RepID=UPI0018E1FB32|nr:uncharacterized protein LOC119780900 [Cyprinodon tularosa]
MNLVENKSLRSHLRDEEAVVVENAVRLAIDSVLNVLYGVNGARTREYQRMVADRDKEIQRLEGRLKEIERELQVLRGHGCTCGLLQNGTRIPANPQTGEQIRSEAGGLGPEVTGAQDCDVSLSLGIYARPSSHFPSHYNESIVPSSPSCLGMNSTCTSGSSETSGIAEALRNQPPTPSSLAVKEEPCDVDAVLIEWELSEERAAEALEQAGAPCPNEQSPDIDNPPGCCALSECAISAEHPEDNEGQMMREKTPGQPPGFQNAAADQLKNKKKNVPTSQLTEEAQRLKRAAWRAASKRYYARKVARQQASLQHIGPVEDRRRRPVPGFPEETQMLRTYGWRSASSRLYSRRTHSLPYGDLMEDLKPEGVPQEPNGEGPHVSGGGIMCS